MARILEVVGDSYASIGTLSGDASGQALYTHWTNAGHSVTLIGSSATPANLNTNYDVVWITNSCPTATDITTPGYTNATIPVLATGVRSPHPSYASATATTPAGTQATIYLKAAGVGAPMVPTDLTTEQTVTVLDTAYNQRYVANTSYGSGVHQVACDAAGTLTHIAWSYYNAGDSMSSSVPAPSKRAWFLFHPGSIGSNARGWQFMDLLLSWAAPTSPKQAYVWDGGAWVAKSTIEVWDGGAWVAKSIQTWNGSSWS